MLEKTSCISRNVSPARAGFRQPQLPKGRCQMALPNIGAKIWTLGAVEKVWTRWTEKDEIKDLGKEKVR